MREQKDNKEQSYMEIKITLRNMTARGTEGQNHNKEQNYTLENKINNGKQIHTTKQCRIGNKIT